MRTKSGLLRLASLLTVTAALAMGFTASASAAPPAAVHAHAHAKPLAHAKPTIVRVPMHLYFKTKSGLRPACTVYGSCGSSWYSIGDLGDAQGRVSYGFDIKYDAYAVAYSVWASGTAHTSTKTDSASTPDGDSWDSGFTATLGIGPAVGGVTYMDAFLDNGGECISGDPVGDAIIS